MPMRKEDYPSDWPLISKRIRERDGNVCRECGVANGAVGARDRFGKWHDETAMDGMNSTEGFYLWPDGWPKIIRIVLTVHHLPEAESKMDCRDEVLVSVCQACHFSMDRVGNTAKAKETRSRKRQEKIKEKGQIVLEMV